MEELRGCESQLVFGSIGNEDQWAISECTNDEKSTRMRNNLSLGDGLSSCFHLWKSTREETEGEHPGEKI